MNTNMAITQTKCVGSYQIGAIRFMMTKKPNWFNRMMAKFLLGWRWIDDK